MQLKKQNLVILLLLSMLLMATNCQAESDSKVMTIADIYANKASLKGKKVKVKGKVVKVSHSIMKLNWVHIVDGTGAMATDKLIFRTPNATPKVNDEVTAEGTIDTDLDFGYGYTYSMLANDATFSQ